MNKKIYIVISGFEYDTQRKKNIAIVEVYGDRLTEVVAKAMREVNLPVIYKVIDWEVTENQHFERR
jgi:hypothetical protein